MIKHVLQVHKTWIAETANVGYYCMLNAKIWGKVNWLPASLPSWGAELWVSPCLTDRLFRDLMWRRRWGCCCCWSCYIHMSVGWSCLYSTWLLKVDILKIALSHNSILPWFQEMLRMSWFCALVKFCFAVLNIELQDVKPTKCACGWCTHPKAIYRISLYRGSHVFDCQRLFLRRYILFCFYNYSHASL